jgi:riboflavin biosynthesis pyrimidine reductase
MDRPHIICHMVTSIDGKAAGDFLWESFYRELVEEYFRIQREYGADGFVRGRAPMEGSFPQLLVTPKEHSGPTISREDHVAEKAGFYAVTIDPQGKLWWQSRALSDPDEGYDGAYIIEALAEEVYDAETALRFHKESTVLADGGLWLRYQRMAPI